MSHTCDHCQAPAKEECSKCRSAVYCGQQCQAAAWPSHAEECRVGFMYSADLSPIPNVLKHLRTVSRFDGLLAAVKKADLVETLSSGEYTVFAPTNAALKAAGADALDGDELRGILLAHVVKGSIMADDIPNNKVFQTVGGGTFLSVIRNGTVSIRGKTQTNMPMVVKTDIPAANGIIHVIDRVITPYIKGF